MWNGSREGKVDRRDSQCLELTLTLVVKNIVREISSDHYGSSEINQRFLQLDANYHIGRLDFLKVASCISLNPDVNMTEIVRFYGLMATVGLLLLLLIENLEMWADFSSGDLNWRQFGVSSIYKWREVRRRKSTSLSSSKTLASKL